MTPPFDKELTIHVSDSSLMHLLLAGMESYKVRHWGTSVTANRGPAETAGLLWGYTVHRDNMDHVIVEHVSTDTFAKGTSSEVGLSEEVMCVKRSVIEERWPYLSLIGDFHTHPYKNYTEVEEAKGWEASQGDRDWYEKYRTPDDWPGRIALILAIGELARYHERSHWEPEIIEDNTLRWQQLERFRFWLSAYAVDECEGNRFVVSPNARSDGPQRPHVYVDVPNVSGTNAWFSY